MGEQCGGQLHIAAGGLSPRGFDAVANIVMHGTFYVTHAVGRRGVDMASNGAWRQGDPYRSVILIIVTWVLNGGPYVVPSAMSKSAIHAMTMSLATEWAQYGVRLNAIGPGEIPTEGMSKRLNRGEEPGARNAKVNRWAGPALFRSCATCRPFSGAMVASGAMANPSRWTEVPI